MYFFGGIQSWRKRMGHCLPFSTNTDYPSPPKQSEVSHNQLAKTESEE